MPSPIFNLFEEICIALRWQKTCVLIDRDFSESILDDVKRAYREPSSMQAIGLAIAELAQHFTERGSVLPFAYDPRTSEFASGDDAYIGYIVNAHEMRGDRESSQKFEIETTYRLATRVTGLLHRVGWPRSKKKTARR